MTSAIAPLPPITPADVTAQRETLAGCARLLYDRRMLDSAGGNLSLRVAPGADAVLMTARFQGSRNRWQIGPEDLLMVRLSNAEILEGEGEISRETLMHLAVYRAFPAAGAVIHAHPVHLMPFVSAGRELPPMSEQTDKFGTLRFTRPAKQHTQDLAEAVVEALAEDGDALPGRAIGCMLPRHGVVFAGKDIDNAYDVLERWERAAEIYLYRLLLQRLGDLDS
jgi:L-fuculose-phosphate aldolase